MKHQPCTIQKCRNSQSRLCSWGDASFEQSPSTEGKEQGDLPTHSISAGVWDHALLASGLSFKPYECRQSAWLERHQAGLSLLLQSMGVCCCDLLPAPRDRPEACWISSTMPLWNRHGFMQAAMSVSILEEFVFPARFQPRRQKSHEKEMLCENSSARALFHWN